MIQLTEEHVAEFYKNLLKQEVTNYTTTVYILLGITVILLGVTWWWNKQGAKRVIEKEVKKKLKQEKEKIATEIISLVDTKLKENEKRLSSIESNTARSIAISARQQNSHKYAVGWLALYLSHSIKADRQDRARSAVDMIISELKKLEGNKVFKLNLLKTEIEQLPKYLNPEKKEINNLIKNKFDLEGN